MCVSCITLCKPVTKLQEKLQVCKCVQNNCNFVCMHVWGFIDIKGIIHNHRMWNYFLTSFHKLKILLTLTWAHIVVQYAQTGSYLQGFDVCGICRSHIETLHEGLKHPLFVWRQVVLLDSLHQLLLWCPRADSPSSEWTLWLYSEARCTAPLCAKETEITYSDISRLRGRQTGRCSIQYLYYLWLLSSRTSDLVTMLTSSLGAKCQ